MHVLQISTSVHVFGIAVICSQVDMTISAFWQTCKYFGSTHPYTMITLLEVSFFKIINAWTN